MACTRIALLCLVAGCGDSTPALNHDLAVADHPGGGVDLSSSDLAGADLAGMPDLSVPSDLSVPDDLATPPDLVAPPDLAGKVKTDVNCGINVTCVDPMSVCCSGDHGRTGACVAPNMKCGNGIPYGCDAPDDCPMGQVCCLVGNGAACTTAQMCGMMGGDLLCASKMDCGNLNCCGYNFNMNGFSHCQAGPCPISLRRYKRDIRYLDAADRQRLRDQLERFPLATWRYRHEGAAAPERLGFIIDDVAPSAAVAPDGQTVDLYGYTTMAVATLQEQQREIAELRAELKRLERQLARPPQRRR
jgi:hypothetical protein